MIRKTRTRIISLITIAMCVLFPSTVQAESQVRIFIDGRQISTDVAPVIINNRTMVPLRAVSEGLGAEVTWQAATRTVLVSSHGFKPSVMEQQVPIVGESIASAANLRSLLKKNNPAAPDLVELYLEIGAEYGIRGDLAFCQAAKETGWWKYGGLVQPCQNNYCGLGATGSPATGEEDLHGADSDRVYFVAGQHGAFFDTPADGVEAHIQHLYAYATRNKLPAGKSIVDPRFTLVSRGIATNWSDLNGRWAVPGVGYGQSIINDYFARALPDGSSVMFLSRSRSAHDEGISIFINGQEIVSDAPPVIINNRTMVPLRAISEGLGADVQWQASTRQVIIKR